MRWLYLLSSTCHVQVRRSRTTDLAKRPDGMARELYRLLSATEGSSQQMHNMQAIMPTQGNKSFRNPKVQVRIQSALLALHFLTELIGLRTCWSMPDCYGTIQRRARVLSDWSKEGSPLSSGPVCERGPHRWIETEALAARRQNGQTTLFVCEIQ